MELFKYRNLTLSSCVFLISLFISFYISTALRVTVLAFAGAVALTFIFIYIIKASQKTLNLMCRILPSALFLILAMIISLIAFNSQELDKFCDEEMHEIKGTVTNVSYHTSYMGSYEVLLESIDNEPINNKINVTLYSEPLKRGDVFSSVGQLTKLTHSSLGFDRLSFSISHGITVGFEGKSVKVCGFVDMKLQNILDNLNSILSQRLKSVENDTTHAIMSALFLGNKSLLADETQRDFSRIGLNHVLALSGMHITIIVTMVGFALVPLPIKRLFKEIILIFSTFVFIGITGFSESALRAGLMVCLVYTLFFFGNRLSITSALFYSVTIICIFNPYSIFSVSLLLSFFAMLGCIASSKFIHRVRFLRRLRFKILRFIVFTFISSVFAILFTLPLISLVFGSISLLSPVTNIIVTPLLSMLLYLCPLLLLVAFIPFVSSGVFFACNKIAGASVFLAQAFSKADNIVLPIKHTSQFIGIIIISIFIFGVLVSKKKHCIFMIIGCLCGSLVFIVGSLFLHILRWNNVYVGAYSFADNDIVFLEDGGEITIFDITKTAKGTFTYSQSVSSYLGYYEIDNYVITDYSSTTDICFDNLSNNVIVKRAFLPPPKNEDEEVIFKSIQSISIEKGIEIETLSSEFFTKSTKTTFASVSSLPRSEKRIVSFSIEYKDSRFTYLGLGSFQLYDKFIDNSVYLSDIIVFGGYGFEEKHEYFYETPNLDYCLFFGSSKSYASQDFINMVGEKETKAHRFLLTY